MVARKPHKESHASNINKQLAFCLLIVDIPEPVGGHWPEEILVKLNELVPKKDLTVLNYNGVDSSSFHEMELSAEDSVTSLKDLLPVSLNENSEA